MQNKASTPVRFWYTRTGAPPPGPTDFHPSVQKHFLSVHQRRQQEYLNSRALICRALSNLYNKHFSYWEFIEKNDRPPIVTNLPGPVYLSLSHSKGFICFAIADIPIGIDAEWINTKRDFSAMAPVFMSQDELGLMPENTPDKQEYFYRLWCAKEALYKALPHKQQKDQTLLSIAYPDGKDKSSTYNLHEQRIDDFQIAIALKGKVVNDLRLIQVDLPSFTATL